MTVGADELRQVLERIVGAPGIVAGEEAHARSTDPFADEPTRAALIVRPKDTREVAAVVAACAKAGAPLVTHGGRTGVAGGARTREGDVVLSLERMRAVEEIDAQGALVVAQGGVPIAALQEAVAAHDLLYPIDLLSQGTATVGGTISTNAGGNRVLRWGMTRQQVLGLEVVLADGTIVDATNRLLKNNTGYDLKQLFIGGEGTLGIVTKAVLRLVPLPTTQSVAFVAVESYPKLLELLARARRLPTLSAFEVMWSDYYRLVARSDTDRAPLGDGHAFYALVETLGYHPEYDEALATRFHEEILAADLVADAVLAASDRERKRLWRVREGGEVIVREMRPFLSLDVSVDLRRTDRCVAAIRDRLDDEHPAARMVCFGHLGDNNIHLAISAGERTAALAHALEAIVYEEIARFDGSISAEHGIGQDKRGFLRRYKSPEELRLMRGVKGLLDPQRRLNPDVLFEEGST
ncbi:MAG TPA: FAD-binding oxidoreductase [Nevskiaceae bacterium]|nr:FAD-binding oxidoreductase [Nevskiaceae bacterium]